MHTPTEYESLEYKLEMGIFPMENRLVQVASTGGVIENPIYSLSRLYFSMCKHHYYDHMPGVYAL